ncbi:MULTISPECIES: hypothetical protein [Streptomyces]|nr:MULTISPECIES: hypothetical protein [Streptomyces]MCH0559017.1 hypothetical protein [Streptomyces sp. MUM 16J]
MSASGRSDTTPDGGDSRAGRAILVIVLLAFPMLKVAWTLGGSAEANEVFLTMGVGSWPDALTGLLLTDALLASMVAVVVCQLIPARFRRAPVSRRSTTGRLAALALTAPLAVGIIVGALYGPGWGIATTLTAYALRTGEALSHGDRTAAWRRKTATAASALSLGIVALVPFVSLAACLDGRAWGPVLVCDVDAGEGSRRQRVIELRRTGPGVVGWDIPDREVVNGVHCARSDDQQVRPAWWQKW